jgi:AmmeMemoRadiSam system protein A
MTTLAEPAVERVLDDSDQKELLRISRATLREYLTTGYLPPGAPHRKLLLAPRAAFVSVYVDGELRGCMGRVEADRPLYLAVEELTVAAATRDPRFEPVRLEELRGSKLEISLLSPLERARPEDIVIGRHGLVITRGPRRGLLLPKVAIEHGWGREQLLDETCAKAGLPPGSWSSPDTQLELFTAEVFGE